MLGADHGSVNEFSARITVRYWLLGTDYISIDGFSVPMMVPLRDFFSVPITVRSKGLLCRLWFGIGLFVLCVVQIGTFCAHRGGWLRYSRCRLRLVCDFRCRSRLRAGRFVRIAVPFSVPIAFRCRILVASCNFSLGLSEPIAFRTSSR